MRACVRAYWYAHMRNNYNPCIMLHFDLVIMYRYSWDKHMLVFCIPRQYMRDPVKLLCAGISVTAARWNPPSPSLPSADYWTKPLPQ